MIRPISDVIFELSDIYVSPNGRLLKYNYNDEENYKIKIELEDRLTKSELDFLRSKSNVAIETSRQISLLRFDKDKIDQLVKVKEFVVLKNKNMPCFVLE